MTPDPITPTPAPLTDGEVAELAALTDGLVLRLPWVTDGAEIYDSGREWMAESYDADSLRVGDARAALIVAAVNALPRLLADRERLAAELAEAQRQVGEYAAEATRLGEHANHLVQQLDAARIARARIAEAHHKHVDAHGGTWGQCAECGYAYPCPTYVWATTDRDGLACWDPADDSPTAEEA